MSKSIFRIEAVDYQSRSSWGDLILFHPSSFSILTYSIFIVAFLLLLLLCLGTYERRAAVGGYLVPTKGLIKIYPKAEGTISEIHIKEGDIVKAGQRLITVSTVRSSETLSDIDSAVIAELKQSQRHLEEKISAESRFGEGELQRVSTTILGLQNEVLQLKEQLSTAQVQFKASQIKADEIRGLIEKGFLAESQYQDNLKEHLNNKLNMQSIEASLIRQTNLMNNAKHELSQLPFKATSHLADFRQSLSELKQKLIILDGKRSYTIVAPVSGRITAMQEDIGRMISSQKMLMAILPEDTTFEADLFVPTHSIGFVALDQKVNVRYKAFPYQRFGTYEGKISNITSIILSPEELSGPAVIDEPVYRVTVELDSQSVNAYGNQLQLQSGMMLDADIILDRVSLVDWVIDPVLRVAGR
jgi:membrane fusion protein